ncbi:response regulator [bacterium]|jgi:CheY-like chemotaxis protein|nr:response regulator [bacterium]
MAKTLLDCGNCPPDFNSIQNLALKAFNAKVLQTHGLDDTIAMIRSTKIDLVTINRKLDRDYSDGIKIAEAIKSDPDICDTPVMLITNYEDHQDAAVAIGCERGFGKLSMAAPSTRELLRPFLGES